MTSSRVFDAIDQNRRKAQDQAENGARVAVFNTEFLTRGAGQQVDATPVSFGIDYLEPPRVSTGLSLSLLPDPDLWLYPLVTAGVVRWLTRPRGPQSNGYALASRAQTPAEASANSRESVYYIGAYLFFVTRVDPIYTQRTDGSLRDYWAEQRDLAEAGSEQLDTAEQNLAEAEFALRLYNEPPKVAVKHYFRFEGTALKLASDLVAKADLVLPTANQFGSTTP